MRALLSKGQEILEENCGVLNFQNNNIWISVTFLTVLGEIWETFSCSEGAHARKLEDVKTYYSEKFILTLDQVGWNWINWIILVESVSN